MNNLVKNLGYNKIRKKRIISNLLSIEAGAIYITHQWWMRFLYHNIPTAFISFLILVNRSFSLVWGDILLLISFAFPDTQWWWESTKVLFNSGVEYILRSD